MSLTIQEDEAKVLQAKKRAGASTTGILIAYRLGQSIPSTREDKLPTYRQTVEYLDLRMI